jgi:hypothetical protein
VGGGYERPQYPRLAVPQGAEEPEGRRPHQLSPSGRVDIRKGLARTKIEKETAEAVAENPVARRGPRRHTRSRSVSTSLITRPPPSRKSLSPAPAAAQDVAVVHTLEEFRPHSAIRAFEKETEPQSAYRVLEAQARCFAGKLGFAVEEGESVWSRFPPMQRDELAVYEAVRGLSDHDLTGLQTLLTALSFSQDSGDRLDTSDSLFNRVARDLSVDMKNHWRPDPQFLGRRNRKQLVAIAIASGYTDSAAQLSTYKKADLVNALGRYFAQAQAEADPSPQQQKARDWLPEARGKLGRPPFQSPIWSEEFSSEVAVNFTLPPSAL